MTSLFILQTLIVNEAKSQIMVKPYGPTQTNAKNDLFD